MSARAGDTSANTAGLAALHKHQLRRQCLHLVLQKGAVQLGAFRHSRAWPCRGQQVGQAAQQAGVVLGGDEAALLVAGRVDDGQVIRPAARDLAPGAEDVVCQKTCARRQAIELVVLLPGGNGPARHVHVHHLPGACLQRHHRKGAGVGKEVEHFHPRRSPCRAATCVCTQRRPSAMSRNRPWFWPRSTCTRKRAPSSVTTCGSGHAARHQPGVGLALVAALVDPVQRRAGASCCQRAARAAPALDRASSVTGWKLVSTTRGKASSAQCSQPGCSPPRPWKMRWASGGHFHRGDGVQQGMHGVSGIGGRRKECRQCRRRRAALIQRRTDGTARWRAVRWRLRGWAGRRCRRTIL